MRDASETGTVPPGEPSPGGLRFFAPGTSLGMRYEIREVLGTGGFAVVYRAYDKTLRREVALKVLRADRHTNESLRRFRREVAVARDVESPRLVRIFDIEDTTETVYLAMELVPGESLRERLRRGPLEPPEAVRIAIQILEGLRTLHGVGVVHRDVKPANVLLTESGEAKLCDFGLAREMEATHSVATATEHVVGTLDYLAPEQALGREIDPRTDLYAVGCVLFEMLTGSVPHKRTTSVATLVAHVQEAAPRVRTIKPGAPAWLDEIVDRLLEKGPSRRYASADAVLAALFARRAGRRVPWVPLRWAAGASVAALLASAAIWMTLRAPPEIRLAFGDLGGLSVTDSRGDLLWKDERVGRSGAAVFHDARRRPQVAAIFDRDANREARSLRQLHLLDGRTGALRRSVALPDDGHAFPGFSDRFLPEVVATDLDGDARDEILVEYRHQPYWPFYLVLWEPALDRARTVFLGSGHHYLVGAVDLDADGARELLLAGHANRLGWYGAVAAVRLVPPVGRGGGVGVRASTPDRVQSGGDEATSWYKLVPLASVLPSRFSITADVERRVLFLPGKMPFTLDFDGFDAERPSSIPAAQRQQARKDIYDALREAIVLIDRGESKRATAVLEALAPAVAAASDPVLSEWVERNVIRALIAEGRTEEAGRRVAKLLESGFVRQGSVLSAAWELHLRGRLADAERWYGWALRERWDPGSESVLGDLLTGRVLALGELGAWEAAAEEAERWRHSDLERVAWVLSSWIAWRRGLPPPPDVARAPLGDAATGLRSYVWLETRLSAGEARDTMLADASSALTKVSEVQPLLLALRAEVLSRGGLLREALEGVGPAFEAVRQAAKRDVVVRAHLDVVARRTAAIARAAGDRGLEAEARRELARIEAERAQERELRRDRDDGIGAGWSDSNEPR